MKYYIAADGGGTKLLGILYDENFRIKKSAKMSGTNSIFRSEEQIAEDIRQLIEELIPSEISEIEGVDLSVIRYEKTMLDLIKQRCHVKSYSARGEGDTALAAAGASFGITAQAGTGSDAFLIQPGVRKTIGGWGFVLGDEGSGYDIGLKTLKAAIYAYDGRGPKTAILDILMEEWELSKPEDLIGRLMGNRDYKRMVASAAGIAAKAAKEKDAVALEIYEQAAHEMAHQVLTVIEWNGGKWEGPIVASGGAWKGCGGMFESFCKDIRARYPSVEITHPVFEPVVGCAVLRRFDAGERFAAFEGTFRKQFASFLYKVD